MSSKVNSGLRTMLNLTCPGLNSEEKEMRRKVHATLKKVTQDLDRYSFNTAVAGVMELVNSLYQLP